MVRQAGLELAQGAGLELAVAAVEFLVGAGSPVAVAFQVAVAFHHHSTGNLDGARSLLARGAATLAGAPDIFLGLTMPPLRASLEQWRSALAEGLPPPALPCLQAAPRC